MSAKFIPPRVPLVDVRTGTITREWYLLLQSLFTFGSTETVEEVTPPSSGDVILALLEQFRAESALTPTVIEIPANDDLTPAVTSLFLSVDDVLPIISGLRDEVAMLRGVIDDMQKGPVF